jgi:protease II
MNCALLENGWTIAYAHVRGGGDKGKQWHHQALKKRALTWSDLEDTVAYLIREKYTHPSVLFMESHSAGAIAVWNMLNKAPHLFKAVVLNYPFLDVLNTLLDPTDALSSSDHA